MAFFITLGDNFVFVLILLGLVWLAFLGLQIATGFLAIRAAFRKQALRAVIWGVLCFALVAAEPLYRVLQIRRAEGAMAAAAIQRGDLEFTGKTVLYVPSRSLDDITFSCLDLVQLSGARTVYLAEPWREDYDIDTPVPDLSQPIDLVSRIKGKASVGKTEFDFDTCTLHPADPPETVDFLLVENEYGDLEQPFEAHLKAHDSWGGRTRLAYLIAPVADARAFRFGPETASLVLFDTYEDDYNFPYSPLFQPWGIQIPRDRVAFEKPLRRTVCREPPDAREPVCVPFS